MKPSMDRQTASALVDAGYMPLREYVQMFGDEVTAPETVPELDDMHAKHDVHERGAPKRPSIMAHFLHLLHHD